MNLDDVKEGELFGDDRASEFSVSEKKFWNVFWGWLKGSAEKGEYKWRYAQSLVSRIDAQLLGVSSPRFALRGRHYTNSGDCLGFINYRRSYLLKRTAKWFASPKEVISNKNRKISPDVDKIQKGFPLPYTRGDGIVALPRQFRKDYYVIEKKFCGEFGECKKTEIVGTPFVGYCTVTGSCVPAVSFIATMLLKDYGITAVHSLPEVARKINASEFPDHVVIETTSMEQIAKYFEGINLSAQVQRFPYYGDNYDDKKQKKKYAVALRSYIKSGMPVLLPVDAYRLHGKAPSPSYKDSVYERNTSGAVYLELDVGRALKANPHAIIIVGCAKQPNGLDFIIHDPKYLPFLKADIGQLWDTRCYENDENFVLCKEMLFLPVLPKEVRLPLYGACFPKTVLGVSEMSERYFTLAQSYPQWFHEIVLDSNLPAEMGNGIVEECRILQIKDIQSVLDRQVPVVRRTTNILREVKKYFLPDHWVWLQWFGNNVLIWDAELPPPANSNFFTGEALKMYLVAVIDLIEDKIKFAHGMISLSTDNSEHLVCGVADLCSKKLSSLAIIASVSTDVDSAEYGKLKTLPRDIGVDPYAFMKNSLGRVVEIAKKQKFQFSPEFDVAEASAVEVMSALAYADQVIPVIGAWIKKEFSARKIRSVATFIPEIMSVDEERRKNGWRALIFVGRLLYELVKDSREPGYLELVVGGRCQGVWPGIDDHGQEVLVTNYLNDNQQTQYLGECLKKLANDGTKILEKVYLAIEVEPGELFAYGNQGGIVQLVKDIAEFEKRNEIPKNRIGLNLDISHWMLLFPGGVPSDFLQEENLVYRRIIHAHVTDGFFHLADAPFATQTKKEKLVEWVNFIKRRCHDSVANAAMPYSGFASVELECACCPDCIEKAVKNARVFLL